MTFSVQRDNDKNVSEKLINKTRKITNVAKILSKNFTDLCKNCLKEA